MCEEERFLTRADLAEKFNVSRQTIHKWMKEPGFPPPVRVFNSRRDFWKESDVDAWSAKC